MRNVLTCLWLLSFLPIFAQREVVTLASGWKFSLGHHDEAFNSTFDDRNWKDITIPHDWGVDGAFVPDGDGSTGKLPWKGQGWYRKSLHIPANNEGKRIYLVFDGIMAFPHVFLNGKLVGKWDYGYNSFYLDVTEAVLFGQNNTLAIHVDTRQHDSRWYPGAGIYRKVQMVTVNPVHVDLWGTFITTPIIKPHYADVRIMTSINAPATFIDTITIRNTMLTATNIKVAEHESKLAVSNVNRLAEATITLLNPLRWDVENPHLYTLYTELYLGGKLIDSYTSRFGVRSIRFTADDGFYLNDKRVQLKGVNLHHDLGALGTAFNKRAMQRQLEIMKDMGCNAIRTSHNIPAPELLDLCDEMGLLVIDEIFDKYDGKADIRDTTDFESFAHRNVRNWILRDRNHPSIFLWSVGNEIGDIQWNIRNGFWKLKTMINYVEKYDDSRPITLVCDNQQSAELRHFDFYDVHAWNYGRRYALARQLEPNKAVIISESASTVSTRGFYEFPLSEKKTDFTNSMQVSSYDLNAPEWAEISDDDFMWQQEEPYIAGEFVWTGFDYLGEPTPYDPWSMKNRGEDPINASRSSYFGIVDLAGIPKDRYYLYKSYWKPDETTIHILPHWNWPERIGKNVPVFVYTNGDCAELFLNGKSLGMQCKKPKSRNSPDRFRLMWKDVIYEPGELKVIAYKAGEKLGEKIIRTTGPATQLRLTPDRTTINANGEDLSYILVEALDKDGNVDPLAMHKFSTSIIHYHLSTMLIDNGNPRSMTPFKTNEGELFYGKAMIIVKSGLAEGQMQIEVKAHGLKSATTEVVVRQD